MGLWSFDHCNDWDDITFASMMDDDRLYSYVQLPPAMLPVMVHIQSVQILTVWEPHVYVTASRLSV